VWKRIITVFEKGPFLMEIKPKFVLSIQ